MNSINSILAVIVLYNEKLYNSKTYTSFLREEVYKKQLTLFVYDNSILQQHIPNEFSDNIIYYYDKNNSGVSKAYNVAAEYGSKNGYKWLLLLDQDSDFSEIKTEDYFASIKNNNNISLHVPIIKLNKHTIFSPTRKYFNMSHNSSKVHLGINLISQYAIINSGMCISIKSFKETGGYNENVWLDYSDYDFLRKYSMKYKYFNVIPKICFQNFSDEEKNVDKIKKRYAIFIECINACTRYSILDNINYELILLKRGISLSIRTKKILFIRMYLLNLSNNKKYE